MTASTQYLGEVVWNWNCNPFKSLRLDSNAAACNVSSGYDKIACLFVVGDVSGFFVYNNSMLTLTQFQLQKGLSKRETIEAHSFFLSYTSLIFWPWRQLCEVGLLWVYW